MTAPTPPSADLLEPPKQKWRFKVRRVSDGTEIVGPVLERFADPVKLPAPAWGKDDNPNDAEVPLEVRVQGHDGRTVRFIVEEEDGQGGWRALQISTAPLQDGVATIQVKLAHPEAEPDLTPDPLPEAGAEPPPFDAKKFEPHAVRARAELI